MSSFISHPLICHCVFIVCWMIFPLWCTFLSDINICCHDNWSSYNHSRLTKYHILRDNLAGLPAIYCNTCKTIPIVCCAIHISHPMLCNYLWQRKFHHGYMLVITDLSIELAWNTLYSSEGCTCDSYITIPLSSHESCNVVHLTVMNKWNNGFMLIIPFIPWKGVNIL